MTVVGFNFTKIVVEKKQAAKGKINIKNNISIKNIEETDLSLGRVKEAGLKFTFEYKSIYDPKVGEITLTGVVLYLEDAKKVKGIVKNWKSDKKVPQELMRAILNTALAKCNIQAIILSNDINLPPPVPLPKVEVRQNDYIG